MATRNDNDIGLEAALAPFRSMAQFEDHEVVSPESPGMDGDTPLHVAAASADEGALTALLPYVSDIDVVGDIGNTPLPEAVLFDSEGAARLLIARGARMDVINDYEESPLALMRDRAVFSSLLIELGLAQPRQV